MELQLDCLCLPCNVSDVGSQRCRIGKGIFHQLKLALNEFITITINETKHICRVSLRKDGCDNYLEIDETVSNQSTRLLNAKPKRVKAILKRLVPARVAKSVEVDVVLSDMSSIMRYRNDVSKLTVRVKEALCDLGVGVGFHVHFAKTSSAYLAGIVKVVMVSTEHEVSLVHQNIDVRSVMSAEKYSQVYSPQLKPRLGGMQQQTQLLEETLLPVLFPKSFSTLGLSKTTGTLLIGPTGTGKTSIIFQLANDYKLGLVYVACSELSMPYPGDSEKLLRDKFEKAQSYIQEGPCVLFFDELDNIGRKRTQGMSVGSSRLLAQLLTLLDGVKTYERLVFVASTSRPSDLDPALRRPGRFDREIRLGMPNVQQRCDILESILRCFPLAEDVDLPRIAECTPGYSGADLALLAQQTAFNNFQKQQAGKINEDMFFEAICKFRPMSQRGSNFMVNDMKPVSWHDIGGLEDVKQQLKWMVELPLKKPHLWARLGLSLPKGVLLFGPPGCCKTTLVRAVATNVKANFVAVGPAQIYSPFVGDSEKAVMEVFQKARTCPPTIVFLDELDALVGNRTAEKKVGVGDKILSMLLNEMDGIGVRIDDKCSNDSQLQLESSNTTEDVVIPGTSTSNFGVFVVAATNRPDLIDTALLRPGRFDKVIYIPPPDLKSRFDILAVISKDMPTADDVEFQMLAEKTELFSGADLNNLCREAALCAVRESGVGVQEIANRHFEEALRSTKPSLTREQLTFYKE